MSTEEWPMAAEEDDSRLGHAGQMENQMESWIKLSDMKESHPVEMAEFAKLNGMSDEPMFAWWTPYSYGKGM